MFIATSRPLNGLLLLALLLQLISGQPSQMVELWCLEKPQPCYRTVVRRRQPVHQAPFGRQLAWLTRWLVSAWPHWLVHYGLLAVLVWKRAVGPPLTWGLLAWPLTAVLCLGLGGLCRRPRWRQRWWRLAHWLAQGYGWVVVVLLVTPASAVPMPLLVGGLLVSRPPGRSADGPVTSAGISTRLFSGTEPGVAFQTGGGSIAIVPGEESIRLWFREATVLELPPQDRTGWRWLVYQLVRQEVLSPQEAADWLDRSLRTVQRDLATYEGERDGACWVDRRRFNAGQHTAYRAVEYGAELVRQWVLNLLTDAPNHGRHLEEQLDGVLDDRTIDRALKRQGLRAAEQAGLRQEVQDFLEAIRQAAYWAGVEGQPLAEAVPDLPDEGWEQHISG